MKRSFLLTIVITLIPLLVLPALAWSAPGFQDGADATTITALRVRSGPGEAYEHFFTFTAGTRLVLEARDAGQWWVLARTTTGGVRGWVSTCCISLREGLELADLPVSGEVIGQVTAPDMAPPVSDIPGAVEEAEEDLPPDFQPGMLATVTTALRMRSGPSVDDEEIALLRRGTGLTIQRVGPNGFWVLAGTTDGEWSGWVSTCCIVPGLADDGIEAAPTPVAPGANWVTMNFISVGSRAREIYLRGQELGRNPHAYAKLGDCNSQTAFFMAFFERPDDYNLGEYDYLQAVIDHFNGSGSRESVTVWGGGAASMAIDPIWAPPDTCQPGETPLACEYRIHNPSVALVSYGINDGGNFANDLRLVVQYSIEQGVIPILGTKADRPDENGWKNAVIRQVAAEYGVPLWDWGRVAETLPNELIWLPDDPHMVWYPPNYTDTQALYTGHAAHNLSALMALDAVWRNAMY